MDYQKYFNNPSIQAFLFVAILIYFIFRIFHILNKRFVIRQNHLKNLRKTIYLLEFLTWLLFVSESIKYFAANNIVIAGSLAIIFLVVIAWTAWFVIKDYVVGLYLKWNDAYKLNEAIQVDGQSGKIIKLGSRFAIIEISPLHTTKISYSDLFTKRVVKTGLTELSANASFTLRLPKDFQYSNGLESIRTYIYQLPWTNLNHKPVVVIEKQDNDQTIIRISASLIDENYLEQFKSNVRTRFE